MENLDMQRLGEKDLKHQESYNEGDKKNKIMKEKSRYFFVHGYDFCLCSFHTRVPGKEGVYEDKYTVFGLICQL